MDNYLIGSIQESIKILQSDLNKISSAGPVGPQGPQGPQGPAGPAGADGAAAANSLPKVYGSWKLASQQTAISGNYAHASTEPIKGWTPVVTPVGDVSFDSANGFFTLPRIGTYMVSVRLAAGSNADITRVYGSIADSTNHKFAGATLNPNGTGDNSVNLYVQFNAMINVTIINTQFKVLGYIRNGNNISGTYWNASDYYVNEGCSLVTIHNVD